MSGEGSGTEQGLHGMGASIPPKPPVLIKENSRGGYGTEFYGSLQ